MVLDLLNQMHEAKKNNCLAPDTFSKVLTSTNYLFYRQAMLGKITKEAKDRYLTNVPESDAIFTYNHHGLENVNQELRSNIEKLDSYLVDTNVNTNTVGARRMV